VEVPKPAVQISNKQSTNESIFSNAAKKQSNIAHHPRVYHFLSLLQVLGMQTGDLEKYSNDMKYRVVSRLLLKMVVSDAIAVSVTGFGPLGGILILLYALHEYAATKNIAINVVVNMCVCAAIMLLGWVFTVIASMIIFMYSHTYNALMLYVVRAIGDGFAILNFA
jgi:hypothetical protein